MRKLAQLVLQALDNVLVVRGAKEELLLFLYLLEVHLLELFELPIVLVLVALLLGVDLVAELSDLLLEGAIGRDQLLQLIVLILEGLLQSREVLVSVFAGVHELFELELVLLGCLDLVDAELSDLLLPGHDLHLKVLDPLCHLLLVLLVKHVDLPTTQ